MGGRPLLGEGRGRDIRLGFCSSSGDVKNLRTESGERMRRRSRLGIYMYGEQVRKKEKRVR